MKAGKICSFALAGLLLLAGQVRAQEKIWLHENFSNNDRKWHVDNNENYVTTVANGKYNIEEKKPDNGTWSFLHWSTYLDPTKDFIIETNLTHTGGKTDNGHGFAWGAKDYNNYYYFTVASTGYYKVSKYDKGTYSDIKPWQQSKHVNGSGTSNKLSIKKQGKKLIFLVNDNEVYDMVLQPFMGTGMGWVLENQMSVSVDDFTVKQDNTLNVLPNLTTRYKKVNLGADVNTKYDEVVPLISADGKTLYYSSKYSQDNTGGTKDPDDIWFANAKNETEWEKRRNMGKPLNNNVANCIISITPDNNYALLMYTYNKDGSYKKDGFSTAYRTERGWSVPEDLEIKDFYNKANNVEACLSSDRKALLMTVQRDDSYGDRDIYVSFMRENGKWTAPKNLGKTVNTWASEMSPFLAADGVTLYYATSGKPGFGDTDIFLTRRLDDTWENWSEPQNLGPDVNTASWDGYYTIPASGKYAYMVSSESGFGGGDIFRIEVPEAAKPKPVVLIYGKVLNSKTKEPMGANINYSDLTTNKEIGIASSDPVTGNYKIVLPAGSAYSFLANKPSFISVSENFDVSKLDAYKEISRDLYLTPIEVGATVRLNNIFFDFGKSTLRKESYPELDRVLALMNENKKLVIEIGGHTDNVGADDANAKLSQSRADAVRTYLLEKGLGADRITAKGYGETTPQATNETDEGRQLNRRVEFKILKN